MKSRAIPIVLLTLVVALGALLLVTLSTGIYEPDYAHLVPAPDAIVWAEGDEIPLWLSTNRKTVDVRVSSIDLGIGEIDLRNPSSFRPVPLGEGLGCLDTVVQGVRVDVTSGRGVALNVTLDSRVTGMVDVYVRLYDASGAGVGSITGLSLNQSYRVSLVAGVPREIQLATYTGFTAGATYRFAVSTDENFPVAITRSVSWSYDGTVTYSSPLYDEEVHLPADTGVSLIACREGDDGVVTLHGDGGEELNRYLVDILPAPPTPTPAPTPTPTPTPVPAPVNLGYEARRVCVDAKTPRGSYLSGGELVGAAFTPAGFGLSGTVTYALSDVLEGSGDVYFFEFESGSPSLLKVSAAGAGDTQGLDDDRVYPVRVTATDANGASAYLDVGVWVDSSTVSDPDNDPNTQDGDGSCS